jgi:CheY-like chemotaxis protein
MYPRGLLVEQRPAPSSETIDALMSASLNRSRGTQTRPGSREGIARQQTRHPGPVLKAPLIGVLGTRYRDDPRAPGAGSASEGRILVVDDEASIRLICRVNLDAAGFDVVEAEDGETALSLARTVRPDLILLDVMLPGIDGWEVAEELSGIAETRDIPIVFITARSAAPDELRSHAVGGVAHIAKPFDPAMLSETVMSVVQRMRRGERDQLRREWERMLPRE